MKWGIWCSRSSVSMLGYAESWMKDKDQPVMLFDTKEDAERYVSDRGPVRNVTYQALEYDGRV